MRGQTGGGERLQHLLSQEVQHRDAFLVGHQQIHLRQKIVAAEAVVIVVVLVYIRDMRIRRVVRHSMQDTHLLQCYSRRIRI